MPENNLINKNTPKKEATISGLRLQVFTPYTEGHKLTANEASVLNQTWIENIRNNNAAAIQELVEKAGGTDGVDGRVAQGHIDEYCKQYIFGERRGGGFRAADPVEAAAMELARGLVRDAIIRKGMKLKDVPASKQTELARSAIDKNPAITEKAKAIVAARQKAASDLTVEF